MYAVHSCERWMNSEQPEVVGAGKSHNKEYLKSKAPFHSPAYSLRGIHA